MRSTDELHARVHQLEAGLATAEQKRNELDAEVKETLTKMRCEYQYMKERVAEAIHSLQEHSKANEALHIKYAETTSAAHAQQQTIEHLLDRLVTSHVSNGHKFLPLQKQANVVDQKEQLPSRFVMRAEQLAERVEDARSEVSW